MYLPQVTFTVEKTEGEQKFGRVRVVNPNGTAYAGYGGRLVTLAEARAAANAIEGELIIK